jgi:hypothetical protein
VATKDGVGRDERSNFGEGASPDGLAANRKPATLIVGQAESSRPELMLEDSVGEHCRRTSGAPFLTWVEVDPSRLRFVSGTPNRYESRPLVTRQCCPNCGTQLTYQHAEEPDIIDVTACSLDTPGEVTPEDHVWCDRMVPWLGMDDDLPRFKLGRFDS